MRRSSRRYWNAGRQHACPSPRLLAKTGWFAVLILAAAVILEGCSSVDPLVMTAKGPPRIERAPVQTYPRSPPADTFPLSTTSPPSQVTTLAGAIGSEADGRTAKGIALLLPLDSRLLGQYAHAVEEGFMASAQAEAAAPSVRVLAFDDGDPSRVLEAYRAAVADRPSVVVGPLSHQAVVSLAASGLVTDVPTLALSIPTPTPPLPPRLYLFGLSGGSEARQVAEAARRNGAENAFIVAADDALDARVAAEFSERWRSLGGRIAGRQEAVQPDAGRLRQAIDAARADVVFLALPPGQARWVRPMLPYTVSVYATSEVFDGSGGVVGNHDLDGVRFVEVPWILGRENDELPAGASGMLSERLRALGMDAYRIALWIARSPAAPMHLSGATGTIDWDGRQVLVPALVEARFSDGKAMTEEAALASEVRPPSP
jgi:outer membrane PBP1 activator LpoA protein